MESNDDLVYLGTRRCIRENNAPLYTTATTSSVGFVIKGSRNSLPRRPEDPPHRARKRSTPQGDTQSYISRRRRTKAKMRLSCDAVVPCGLKNKYVELGCARTSGAGHQRAVFGFFRQPCPRHSLSLILTWPQRRTSCARNCRSSNLTHSVHILDSPARYSCLPSFDGYQGSSAGHHRLRASSPT